MTLCFVESAYGVLNNRIGTGKDTCVIGVRMLVTTVSVSSVCGFVVLYLYTCLCWLVLFCTKRKIARRLHLYMYNTFKVYKKFERCLYVRVFQRLYINHYIFGMAQYICVMVCSKYNDCFVSILY